MQAQFWLFFFENDILEYLYFLFLNHCWTKYPSIGCLSPGEKISHYEGIYNADVLLVVSFKFQRGVYVY